MVAGTSARGMPVPGDTIDGKYTLIRVLGTGGMGVVFEAEHLRLKQRCAIKMLSADMLREPDLVRRFEREARASAVLRGPHVTRVTDVATTPDGLPYIVMELLSGRDLEGELEHRRVLPYAEAVDYLLQACAAIAEAHAAGIIHRDLKPGNLFLAQEQDRTLVKVLDFGISKMVEEEKNQLTSANMTMGTAFYMSPEQLRSAATVDARADIWSLGIILYELLCGEPPFGGTTAQIAAAIVSEDAPDIARRCSLPAELAAVIHKTLRRSPADRYASVVDLVAALSPFAPEGSLGQAIAAQISRRDSSRNLTPFVDRRSSPDVAPRERPVEASTGVSHAMNTSAKPNAPTRMRFIAVLVVVALLGAVAVAVAVLRPRDTSHPTAAGSSSATTAPVTAASTAAVAPVGTVGTAAPIPSPSATETAPPVVASAAPTPPVRPTRPSASTTPARPTAVATPRPTAAPRPSATATVNPTFLQ